MKNDIPPPLIFHKFLGKWVMIPEAALTHKFFYPLFLCIADPRNAETKSKNQAQVPARSGLESFLSILETLLLFFFSFL